MLPTKFMHVTKMKILTMLVINVKYVTPFKKTFKLLRKEENCTKEMRKLITTTINFQLIDNASQDARH